MELGKKLDVDWSAQISASSNGNNLVTTDKEKSVKSANKRPVVEKAANSNGNLLKANIDNFSATSIDKKLKLSAMPNNEEDCDLSTSGIVNLAEVKDDFKRKTPTDNDIGRNNNSKNDNNNATLGDLSIESIFEDKNGRPVFNPKRILILTKLTRLEFERRTNPNLTDEELSKTLKERGSDYGRLLTKYRIHTSYVDVICEELTKKSIDYRLVQRWDYNEENIDWADVIFTAGGDGTFLLAASKIRNRNKPVIGINTDPSGSEGYMCLLKKMPEHKFADALGKLLKGEFKWLWRQRIRVTLSGKHAFDDPIELHDQQLMYPEYRWAEHVREYEDMRTRLKGHFKGASNLSLAKSGESSRSPSLASSTRRSSSQACELVLPYLALNEVFIGESLSSRVSYYELQIDNGDRVKQKSSGFTACTGTGSTSWYFNINKLTEKCVSDLMNILTEELGIELPSKDPALVGRLCRRFNDQLIFSPSDLRLAFAVRDPVFNATYRATAQRGFAHRIVIKSRCFDAHLVIDGGLSYIFNDGAQATLEMCDEDALRTVVFR